MSGNPFHNLSKAEILEALSGSLGSADLQASLNLLRSRHLAASESPAYQGYGQATPSRSWNNIEPSTPAHTSFSSLNLNSVDEEDEFLYGDSNSVPEAQIPVQNDSAISNSGRIDTGWSDEDDPFSEIPDTTSLNKLNSRLKKNLTDYDSQNQNKFQESQKVCHIKQEEIDIADTPPVEEVHAQRYVSQKQSESHRSTLSPLEKKEFPETGSASTRDKSKYHIAAELLKKRTAEKQSAVNSNSSEKDIIPGTSKKISEVEKTSYADLKTETDKRHQRQKQRILNKRHVDDINDYLAKPQRKRPHLPEEYPEEKHPRYENSRSYSPSRHEISRSHSPSRHHSPPRSSIHYKYKTFNRDNIKYDSRRSPSFESEKYHSSTWYKESRRRYSPSPKRWSGSRSPDYKHARSHEKSSKYKDRSPRSRRSRSKSPGYYSSRSKTYDKKRSKSPKKSDYYSKKKEKSNYSSSDSFCSLSFESTDSSSDSSDENSDKKRSSKKSPIKKALKDNKKLADEKANLKGADGTNSKLSDSATLDDNDLSTSLSDIIKNEPSLWQTMCDAMQPANNKQFLINLLEQQLQQQHQQQQQSVTASSSLTLTAPTVSNVSNMQMSGIPSSETYAYPTIPSAPVQYMSPQMTNFPQMTPATAFPAPIMPTPPAPVMPLPPAPVMTTPPIEYGPYLQNPTPPSNGSQYDANLASKSSSIRPSVPLPRRELRTIPVLDSLPASTTAYSNTNNIAIIPNNTPLQKLATDTKIQEEKLSLPASKKLPEKAYSKEKEAEKNISSSSRLTKESTSERNKDISEQKKNNTSEQNKRLIIEKFKKMKAERARALNKAKSASEDLDEMRKMLDNTFGKKISSAEKVLYTKCKVQFNYALDMANQKNKEASRMDENLSHFKSRLPTSMLDEVNKIKLEECLDKPVIKEKYSCLDQGDHTCSDCYVGFNNIKEMLDHIRTPEHKKRMELTNQDWKRHFVREEKEDANEHKKTVLKAVKGVEFVKPLTGFYCSLCKEILLEESSVETHLKGHRHYEHYDKYCKEYCYRSVSVNNKHLYNVQSKELDDKKMQRNEMQSEQLDYKKIEAVNEIRNTEQNNKKEQIVDEIQNKKIDDLKEEIASKILNKLLQDNRKKEIVHEHTKTSYKKKDEVPNVTCEKREKEVISKVQNNEQDDKEKETVNKHNSFDKTEEEMLNLACKKSKFKLKAIRNYQQDSDSSSENEELSEVQKILAGKQKKDKSGSTSDACTKVINKTVNKFVFIGKTPGYKQKVAEKKVPWYKRKSILNKTEDNSGNSTDLSIGK